MTTRIRGKGIDITPDLQDYVEKKLSKLDRYLPNIDWIEVELTDRDNNRGPDEVIAQLTLRHTRGAVLRTEERIEKVDAKSIQSALLAAIDKMYRRIRRFKNKPISKRNRERYHLSPEEMALAEPLPEYIEQIPEPAEEEVAGVVRRKTVMVNAMHEDEAIEQMELLGHNFFVYFDAETNRMNVLYRRSSGGYGVLEPTVE